MMSRQRRTEKIGEGFKKSQSLPPSLSLLDVEKSAHVLMEKGLSWRLR